MRNKNMRFVCGFVAVVAAIAVVGCGKKSTVATAPVVIDSTSVAGAWAGCITEPHVSCVSVSMTLTDSSLTDTTAALAGTGNWGDNVVLAGHLVDLRVTLDGKTSAVLQGWSFDGVLSGNTLSGNLTIPGVDSSYSTTFTRSP
jgi:hypothetical protein